jgi:hypothetical protein
VWFLGGVAPGCLGAALEIRRQGSNDWVRLSAQGETGMVYQIQASADLAQWTPFATTHDGIFDYPDAATDLVSSRFYSFARTRKGPGDDWKNQVHFPEDAFQSGFAEVLGPDFRWIKFAIVLSDPGRVYYQDSGKYDFHYDFASRRLQPFIGLTPAQFEQIALHTNQQQVLLGTLLIPPFPNDAEFGIQFVGLDAYPPELVSKYFDLVRATVVSGAHVSAFYVPTYEQARVAETNRSYFEARGIRLASAERWIVGDDIYSPGWALGRLKFFPGAEINAAFGDGRLRPEDILLTDGVPAEIPVLAGVLTLTPSTPNSHVAILAKTFGLPFGYISDPAQRARVQALAGKDIVLRLDPFFSRVRVTELESSVDPALRAEILKLKSPPRLNIIPKAKYGGITAPTDNLTPADIKFFGGKASNYGFLRRKIPQYSAPAIAFSFDLWDEFLDQTLPGGKTLRTELHDRLAGYTYPPNVAALKRDLADIRTLIRTEARFTEAQQQAIITALGPFDQSHNIRFRSSTNVEDSEQFTGAGLYDSYSGCLLDDLDGDGQGPSQCDPTENEERGVFRAIQRVYASFYNDNAFIERLRHGLDETTVGMALLVHRSAPDPTEMANGVATMQADRGTGFDGLYGDLVTQKGAVSVTNPDGSARPEVFQGYHHAQGTGGWLRQRSSLVPLGAYVMQWDKDYIQLMKLLSAVADGFHGYYPAKKQYTLDFEYKKLLPGVLEVKQVREIPVNVITNNYPAYLVHETNRYWVLQGEAADVFSNHRLKSFWSFHARNIRLSGSNLAESLFARVEGIYLEGGQTNLLAGAPGSFPNASHRVNGDVVIDRWTSGTGTNRRDFELRTEIRRETSPQEAPVLGLADLRLELSVNYSTPQPVLAYDFSGLKPMSVTNHAVTLEPRRALTSQSLLQERSFSTNGLSVQIEFYWPAPPSRGIGDKTAPLAQWKETKISGLTSEPILLRGEFSQTYRPGHHNFSEEFVFEPSLEEGLPDSVLAELRSANVQLIHVEVSFGEARVWILGLDGRFRNAP